MQVPGYLAHEAELKAAGIDEVLVYCVNDGAVMAGWAADQGIAGSMITFLADTRAELTKALGLELTHEGPMHALGNMRCKGFAAIVEDGTITHLNVSEADGDPAGDNDPEGPVTALTRVETMLQLAQGAKL